MMARGPFDPRPDPRGLRWVRVIAAGLGALWLALGWVAFG